jgi:hypothetical protein
LKADEHVARELVLGFWDIYVLRPAIEHRMLPGIRYYIPHSAHLLTPQNIAPHYSLLYKE